MFGALNRFISRLDADGPQRPSSRGQNAFGFQVLRNENTDIPIDPWFDFIVGINGRLIDDSDPRLFSVEIANCAGSTVSLTVWSSKGNVTRTLSLAVPAPPSPPSLRLTLQWNNLLVSEDVWHILDIIPSSPADAAGLLPYSDYIIGTPDGIVRGEAGMAELLEDYLDRVLRLYVYNHEYDVTRLVTITPSRSWGGNGALGCVLGYGALHRIPAALTEPPQAPGETLFEHAPAPGSTISPSSRPGSSLSSAAVPMIPVTAFPPQPSHSPAVRTASPLATHPMRHTTRKPRHSAFKSPDKAFDEYFAESEKKSREEDFVPSSKGKAVPPPPHGTIAPPPKGGPVKSPPPQPQVLPSETGAEEGAVEVESEKR